MNAVVRALATSCLAFAFLGASPPPKEPLFVSSELFLAPLEVARREAFAPTGSAPRDLTRKAAWLTALAALEYEAWHPHAATRAWKELDSLCDEWRGTDFQSFQGRTLGCARAACALATAELTQADHFPIFLSKRSRLLEDAAAFRIADLLEEEERLSLNGRLLIALSPLYGQDLASGIVFLQFLDQVAPNSAGTHYWMGLAHFRKGDLAAAEKSFLRAQSTRDPRALLRRQTQKWGELHEPTFGWVPTFQATPSRGIGVGVILWDDRLGDARRGFQLEAQGSTRGNLTARGRYQELSLLEPATLAFSVAAGTRVWDYFGAGMLQQGLRTFQVLESEWTLSVLSARYGWFQAWLSGIARTAHSNESPPYLSVKGSRGVGVGMQWDGTDRLVAPQRGLFLQFRFEWLWANQSNLGFYRLLSSLSKYWQLRPHHLLNLSGVVQATGDSAPFNARSDLATLGVPGIREFRYQDVRIAALWLRYGYQRWSWASLGGFLTLAGAAGGFTLIPSALRWGAGVEMDFHFARTPRMVPRFELGLFNGEWIVQAGVRL